MPVPTSPQDLIDLIREKLFNNTSGLIEEPDLREVLENIVKVLDAKFSLLSPNLTPEQFEKWDLLLDYMAKETKGVLSPSSPTPTEKGKYLLSSAGTYANLGGLVATADKLNYAYFDGTTWSKVEVQATQNVTQNIFNNTYNLDPEQIVPSEALYTDDTLAGDILKRVDKITGENVNYRETTTWHDGSQMDDAKVDGVIYKKIGNKYFINVSWIAGLPISVKNFGAKGDNETNDTVSFTQAMNTVSALGGGKILIPKGKYRLKDFTIDKKNVVFVGESTVNSYEVNNINVSLRPVTGSVFIARLKGGVSAIDAGYSGFSDVMFDGENNVDYGVFIDSGVTIMHRCIVQHCNYGTIIGGAGNSNEFIGNVWNSNRYVGFGISEEDAATFIHPNIIDVCQVSTTKIIFKQNKCRQNGFGMVIREGVNIIFKDSVFESNKQAGIYYLRTNNSSLYNIKMLGCWAENNYDWSYQDDWEGYSFNGNRMFLLANNVYQQYEKPKQLGFQMVIDSQTRNNSGGSGSNYDFEVVEFNPVYGSQQKSVKIISAFNVSFRKCGFTGDTNGRFSVDDATTHGVYIEEPFAINYNTLFESGFKGTVILNGEFGKRFADKGTSSAPIYFPQLPSNDWRVTDPNILHSYIEGTYDGQISTASGNVFDITNKISTYTKIGRLIHIEVRGSVTVNQILNYDEVFYISLPYPAITDQNIIGQVFIKPTGSTVPTALANNGEAMLYTNTVVTVMSNKPVFHNLEVGQTFDIKYCATYTSSE